MPRGFMLWLIVMSVIGWGVYQLKYQVQSLDGQLTRINREIVAEQDAIHVLKAEWSYLNQPHQIADMATKFLAVAPIGPRQMVTLSAVPTRAEGEIPVAKATGPGPRKPAPATPPIAAAPSKPAATAPVNTRPHAPVIPKDSLQLVRNGDRQ
jgi:hypothetical protein